MKNQRERLIKNFHEADCNVKFYKEKWNSLKDKNDPFSKQSAEDTLEICKCVVKHSEQIDASILKFALRIT
jgi:transcription termination factor NusB